MAIMANNKNNNHHAGNKVIYIVGYSVYDFMAFIKTTRIKPTIYYIDSIMSGMKFQRA